MKQLKFLLDEHVEGFDKKLLELGHSVEYAKKLKENEEKLRNDFNLLLYAPEKNMIFVTKDKEPGQTCKDNNFPCIWLSGEIYKTVSSPKPVAKRFKVQGVRVEVQADTNI